MAEAVESAPGIDPDRAAFTVALEAARDQVITADGVLIDPGQAVRPGRIGQAVLDNLLPRRRPRVAPRKVKCPISRYASPPSELHITTAAIVGVDITVRQVSSLVPEGRRDRTLQLMRTDPERTWRAGEIATGLGFEDSRSLRAELGRWVKEGILCRIARGVYTLVEEWTTTDLQQPADPVSLTAASSP